MTSNKIIKPRLIENHIHSIRGIQVMLDIDLAEMYGVETKRLNEQVKRNIDRFPDAFRFQCIGWCDSILKKNLQY